MPGRTYAVHGQSLTCEMVQVEPLGREISAVNVPASAGTHVLAELLSELDDGRSMMESEWWRKPRLGAQVWQDERCGVERGRRGMAER